MSPARRPVSRWLLLSTLALVGCGEPLVDGTYPGEPLAVVEGNVFFRDDVDDGLPQGELRVALFWSASGVIEDDSFEAVDSVQQQVVTTATFPASYRMTIYQPPPSALLEDVPGTEFPAAVGIVLLYIDADGDGRWTDEGFEPLVGGSVDDVVLWAPEGLDGEVVGDPIEPGFHAVFPERDALCVDEAFVPLEVDDQLRIDLEVGPALGSTLYDLDCDSVIDEWCSLCPSFDQFETICEQAPSYCDDELGHCPLCYE